MIITRQLVSAMLKLNLGSGSNKIDGFINIDLNPDNKPDLVANILEPLPYNDGSIDEIVLFHTIEHIQKRLHRKLFREMYRLLSPDGKFILSYPEFSNIARNWLENKFGEKDFWEATIYGRQLFAGDFHVCAMDSLELKLVLAECGLTGRFEPEKNESYNTVMHCFKDKPFKKYDEAIREDMIGILK